MHDLILAAAGSAIGAAHTWSRGSSGSALVTGGLMLAVLGGLALRFLWVCKRHGQEDEGGDSGSGGGGGPRRPGRPPGPGGDPVWWAEFERDFAVYVRTGGQERRPTERLHARATDRARHVPPPTRVSGFPYPRAGVEQR